MRPTEDAVADEYVRQLTLIRKRLRRFPEGHGGLQLAAAYRIADLIRMGRQADVRRIAEVNG